MKYPPFLLVFLLAAAVRGDIVTLNDGTRLEGSLKREEGGWSITDAAGKVIRVTDDRIKGIEKTSGLSAAATAQNRLGALRRFAQTSADLNQIIDRYARFIAETPPLPARDEAKAELATWEDRKAKGMVKVGGAWMTPRQRAELLGKTLPIIEEARTLIRDNRPKEAAAALDKLLSLDPDNVSGLYLRGVLAHRQDQVGLAKKSFERVRELMPDHGPTLNNLAVILWQQKQRPAAMALYDLAMQASPVNRRILDNVAEALFALRDERESASIKKVQRRFEEQDARLQKELEPQGLHRWGGTYVTTAQKAELDKAQQRIKARLDLLVEEYDNTRARLKEIDSLIESNQRSMRRIRDNAEFVDPVSGRVARAPLPSAYWQIKRENDALEAEEDTLTAKLDTFKEREMAIWREAPIPQYTGRQQIFDVEGTPLEPLPAPGSADQKVPQTQPSHNSIFKE